MVAGGDIDKDLILAEGQYPVIANALTGDGIVGYYDKEYRVNAPAVTVTGRGDVGHAKARLVNFTPVVRLLSVKSEHDVFFLENAINTLKIVIESTGVPQLTVPQLAKYEVAFPRQLDEEEHIGAFFKQLDHLITLHQRQPFSHSTPEISLSVQLIHPFYTSSWEQRKFDEVFDCTVPNNTLSRAELSYDEGTVLNVHYGDVLIKYGSVLDVQKDDIPRIPHRCREDFNGALLQDGDVIIADTAEDETTGKACEIGNLQGSAIVSGLHTMVCRPRNRMALGYLGYYLNSNAYHHQLLPLMQGIKVLSLSRSNIQKTSVSYPIAVKEQQLIAYYFSQLDNLITLHQRKGKAAVSGCSNDANNSKGVCCKARDFGYKCHKKDESK